MMARAGGWDRGTGLGPGRGCEDVILWSIQAEPHQHDGACRRRWDRGRGWGDVDGSDGHGRLPLSSWGRWGMGLPICSPAGRTCPQLWAEQLCLSLPC